MAMGRHAQLPAACHRRSRLGATLGLGRMHADRGLQLLLLLLLLPAISCWLPSREQSAAALLLLQLLAAARCRGAHVEELLLALGCHGAVAWLAEAVEGGHDLLGLAGLPVPCGREGVVGLGRDSAIGIVVHVDKAVGGVPAGTGQAPQGAGGLWLAHPAIDWVPAWRNPLHSQGKHDGGVF